MEFTPKQIEAAQYVFVARQFLEKVKSGFTKWKTEILATRNFHYAEKFYAPTLHRLHNKLTPDKILVDPKYIHFMEGISEEHQPGWEATDAGKFFKQLSAKAQAENLLYGADTELIASRTLEKKELQFLEAIKDLHKEDMFLLRHRSIRDNLFNLWLPDIAPYAIPNIKNVQLNYWNEYLINKISLTEIYANNEQSFEKFVGLKHPMTIEAFLIAKQMKHRKNEFLVIDRVWCYDHFSFIFEISDNKIWKYQGQKLTGPYVYIAPDDTITESQELKSLEQKLFGYFLQHFNA